MNYRPYILFFFLFGLFQSIAAKHRVDSLVQLTVANKPETKIWALEELYYHYESLNKDSALKYALIGVDIADKANFIKHKAHFLIKLGSAYIEKADFGKALDKFIEAEKFFKEIKDLKGAIHAINNIGYVYEKKNMPETAIIQYETALSVAQRIDDKEQMAQAYNLLGSVYFNRFEDEKALDNFSKALELNKQLNLEEKIVEGLNNIAVIYKDLGRVDEALANFFQLLNYARKNDHLDNQIVAYHNIAITYLENKKEDAVGLLYLDSSASVASRYHNFDALMTIYATYSDFYSKKKDFEKAFDYYKLKFAANDSLLQRSRDKEFIEMSTKYGSEKKEAENKLLKTESEKQRAVTIGISIGLVLVLMLAFFVFRSYRQKQKANLLLAAQNTEINEKKTIIEEKQKEILDSISYAKRLQEAILPPVDLLHKYFGSVFIYYKPKDIVAGDFYWMEHKNGFTFIAAADCTGHGVPGAMVSVVCSNALNRAVLEFNLNDPGKILDKTRDLVLETFSKSDKDVKDGMDISLLVFNAGTGELKWAGANNPLWYTENGKMIEIISNKQAIGKTDDPKPFTTHTIKLEKNSSVFLFTDGYADQFGGEKGKKFKYKPLQSVLLENAHLSSNEQKEKLKTTFSSWKGDLEQVDDVCVIGIRI
jgi:serine phosphatase RsbU (regulator of sigma subunit)/Tfp pilus assembly protein PilF